MMSALPPLLDNVAVLLSLIVAIDATLCTTIIHGVGLSAMFHFVRHQQALGRTGVRFSTNAIMVTVAVLFALVAHLVEIALWALVLQVCGEFHRFATALYHSAVNYTSLGYGDVVMSPSWKLLGPLETVNGMLLFGVSTAMIFTVIQRVVQPAPRDH